MKLTALAIAAIAFAASPPSVIVTDRLQLRTEISAEADPYGECSQAEAGTFASRVKRIDDAGVTVEPVFCDGFHWLRLELGP